MRHLNVRVARVGECEALTRLARAAKASWGYPAQWLEEWAPALSFTPEYVRRHHVLVAEAGGTVIGVVSIEADSEPEIGHLWVAPDHHGRGIGRALVHRAVRHARERGWSALRVESDPNALGFYEGLGAVRVGEVESPVGGVERRLPLLRLPVRGFRLDDEGPGSKGAREDGLEEARPP